MSQVETDQFVATITEVDGMWTATIAYKNGAGIERWSAPTYEALTLELLKGKGNASLRVKEAVRVARLGGPKLDKQYQLPENISPEKFNRYPDEVKTQVVEAIALKNASLFRDLHPEFMATDRNGLALNAFLQENNFPMTVRNLEYAFECLLEENKLDVKKAQPAQPARHVEEVDGETVEKHQRRAEKEPTHNELLTMPLADLKRRAHAERRAHSTVDQKLVDRGTLHAVI
jgi:hypothetical protein